MSLILINDSAMPSSKDTKTAFEQEYLEIMEKKHPAYVFPTQNMQWLRPGDYFTKFSLFPNYSTSGTSTNTAPHHNEKK